MIYDDFYENSEIETKIGELKELLENSIRTDFLTAMDELRKENEGLKEFAKQREEHQQEIERIKKARLKELMHGMSFEDIRHMFEFNIVFEKESGCRKYCDWLNEEEKKAR